MDLRSTNKLIIPIIWDVSTCGLVPQDNAAEVYDSIITFLDTCIYLKTSSHAFFSLQCFVEVVASLTMNINETQVKVLQKKEANVVRSRKNTIENSINDEAEKILSQSDVPFANRFIVFISDFSICHDLIGRFTSNGYQVILIYSQMPNTQDNLQFTLKSWDDIRLGINADDNKSNDSRYATTLTSSQYSDRDSSVDGDFGEENPFIDEIYGSQFQIPDFNVKIFDPNEWLEIPVKLGCHIFYLFKTFKIYKWLKDELQNESIQIEYNLGEKNVKQPTIKYRCESPELSLQIMEKILEIESKLTFKRLPLSSKWTFNHIKILQPFYEKKSKSTVKSPILMLLENKMASYFKFNSTNRSRVNKSSVRFVDFCGPNEEVENDIKFLENIFPLQETFLTEAVYNIYPFNFQSIVEQFKNLNNTKALMNHSSSIWVNKNSQNTEFSKGLTIYSFSINNSTNTSDLETKCDTPTNNSVMKNYMDETKNFLLQNAKQKVGKKSQFIVQLSKQRDGVKYDYFKKFQKLVITHARKAFPNVNSRIEFSKNDRGNTFRKEHTNYQGRRTQSVQQRTVNYTKHNETKNLFNENASYLTQNLTKKAADDGTTFDGKKDDQPPQCQGNNENNQASKKKPHKKKKKGNNTEKENAKESIDNNDNEEKDNVNESGDNKDNKEKENNKERGNNDNQATQNKPNQATQNKPNQATQNKPVHHQPSPKVVKFEPDKKGAKEYTQNIIYFCNENSVQSKLDDEWIKFSFFGSYEDVSVIINAFKECYESIELEKIPVNKVMHKYLRFLIEQICTDSSNDLENEAKQQDINANEEEENKKDDENDSDDDSDRGHDNLATFSFMNKKFLHLENFEDNMTMISVVGVQSDFLQTAIDKIKNIVNQFTVHTISLTPIQAANFRKLQTCQQVHVLLADGNSDLPTKMEKVGIQLPYRYCTMERIINELGVPRYCTERLPEYILPKLAANKDIASSFGLSYINFNDKQMKLELFSTTSNTESIVERIQLNLNSTPKPLKTKETILIQVPSAKLFYYMRTGHLESQINQLKDDFISQFSEAFLKINIWKKSHRNSENSQLSTNFNFGSVSAVPSVLEDCKNFIIQHLQQLNHLIISDELVLDLDADRYLKTEKQKIDMIKKNYKLDVWPKSANENVSNILFQAQSTNQSQEIRTFHAVSGSILDQNVECIVNAANEKLEHIGGIAKVISDAAGNGLKQECKRITLQQRINTGTSYITPSFDISMSGSPISSIVHTVGPRWSGGISGERTLLKKAIISALQEASNIQVKSIAIPAVSCGIFMQSSTNFSANEETIIGIIIESVLKFFYQIPKSSIQHVTFIDSNRAKAGLFALKLDALCSSTTSITPVSTSPQEHIKWQWREDEIISSVNCSQDQERKEELTKESAVWSDYDPEQSQQIEIAYQRYLIEGESASVGRELLYGDKNKNQNGFTYSIHFNSNKWYQQNTSEQFQTKRRIQREKIDPSQLLIPAFNFLALDHENQIKIEKVNISNTPSVTTNDSVCLILTGLSDNVGDAKQSITEILNAANTELIINIPNRISLIEIQGRIDIAIKGKIISRISYDVEGNRIFVTGKGKELVKNDVDSLNLIISDVWIKYIDEQNQPPPDFLPMIQQDEDVVVRVEINQSSEEAQKLLSSSRFYHTLPQKKITKIERVQNLKLWREYAEKRMKIKKRCGNDGEGMYWHGTSSTDPQLICTNGFNFRYSDGGMWGRGSYFAMNASYSDSYAYKNGNQKQFFVAFVTLGKQYDCPSNKNLREPPSGFNSVTGETGGSRVFIIYDSEQSYPAYLITYEA